MSVRKERAQFEQAVLPHADALYGGAYRLTRNAGDAEDLVQDTLLRAYRFWASFSEGSNCKAWLFKILTNTFINSYQKKKRAGQILGSAKKEQAATGAVLYQENSIAQKNPQEILLEGSLSEDVEKALVSLPADFRIVVMLCDVQGFTYKEIAEIVECPVGTVMSRLHRGRRILKNELLEYAQSQGIVRETQPSREGTIDFQQYRQKASRD